MKYPFQVGARPPHKASGGAAMKAVQPGNDSRSRRLAGITHHGIDVAGRQRSYTLAEPTGTGTGASLVLVFHGSNQTGGKFRAFTGNSFDALASTSGAVVAYAA